MLLKNDNQKFIKTLSSSCLKANKNRNRIAVAAIILTTILFMTVATVFQGSEMTLKAQSLKMAGNQYMVAVNYVDRNTADKIKEHPDFVEAGLSRTIGTVQNRELSSMTIELMWADENYAKNTYKDLTMGYLPEKEDEIAIDTEVARKLGIPAETGEKFILHYETDGKEKEKEMTVCGIWQGVKYGQKSQVFISETFAEANSGDGNYAVSGIFESEDDLGEHLNQVLEDTGVDPEKTAHDICPAYLYEGGANGGTIFGVIISIILVLIAGYLIIYNIFRISVIKDIRLYGQLKTIGASPRQIKYMVRRQGMKLLVFGMPLGLVLGWLLGNLLLLFLMNGLTYSEAIFVVPGILVWVAAGLFTFVTVWISCSKPGKLAGRISPVEALRYQEKDTGKKKERKGKGSKHRIAAMAVANLSRNKGKTVLVVLSISISIVLLNSVLNVTQCFDKETYVRRDAVADFNVSSNMWTKTASNTEKVVPADFVKELKEQTGIKDLGFVYYHPVDYDKETEGNRELVEITSVNGTAMPQNIEKYDFKRQIFGYDENALKRMKVIEGEIDYEKLKTEDYILMAGYLSDGGEYYEDTQEFHPGDRVSINVAGKVKTYTVMAVVGAPTQLLTDYSSGGYENVAMSAEQFLKLYPEALENPIHCIFDAKEGQFDHLMKYIDTSSQYFDISVMTKQKAEQDFDEITAAYDTTGMILALIFAVIGLLNLLNVIMTGAIARQNEFAVMRSIGMTRRQLRKLFILEGVSYVILAAVAATFISALMSATVVQGILSGFWFAQYHFTVLPALTMSILFIGVAVAIAYVVDKIYNQGNIIENLRKVE